MAACRIARLAVSSGAKGLPFSIPSDFSMPIITLS